MPDDTDHTPPPPPAEEHPQPREDLTIVSARPRWDRLHIGVLIAIVLLAGGVRFIRLDVPASLVFDENHYAPRACLYLHPEAEACTREGQPAPEVHPPLGHWLIATGISLFGYDSFGWRLASALAGTISVALLFLLARHLLRSLTAAAVAAGLLALDPLHFVQSRVAMLDIFIFAFGLMAFLFLLHDRDRMAAAADTAHAKGEPIDRGGLIDRPWRFAAGASAGAAIACKWSGALVLLMVVVLTLAWELASRRADGSGHAFRRTLREESLSIALWLLMVPFLVYLATYIGRVEGSWLAAPWSDGAWFRAVWDHQAHMLDFHFDFNASHSYSSPAWSWLLLKRPVAYAFESSGGQLREVMALGNPFTWWASVLALIYVAVRWARKIDFTRPEGFILAGFILMYLPWFLVTRRNVSFVFYLLPALPFMFLATGLVVQRIFESWEGKAATAIVVVGTISSFVFYYPVVAYVPLSQAAWETRVTPTFFGRYKLFVDCDKPETTSVTTETTGKKTVTRTTTDETDPSAPPNGWCWI